jgi:carboxyl-terminal processing protease
MGPSRLILAFAILYCVVFVPSAARAQAAPGPFVKQAFDLLMDRFVVPPTSNGLLEAGWAGGVAHVKETAGAEPTAPTPSFTGDRAADWSAFLAGYPALAGAIGASGDQHPLDYAIVGAMAKSLNSSHTFISASPQQPGQSFAGVGIQMSRELVVTEVFPGTPAEAAGLRLGDRIIAVDGASVEGMKSDEVSPRVRGPVGSAVQFTVVRGGHAEPLTVTATRAEISVPWVNARVLDGGIGYLRIRQFPPLDSIGLFDQAVAMLDGADIKALVIDVRNNPGGFYATSARAVSRFVRDGSIRECAPREGQVHMIRTDGSAWNRNAAIALLVNDQTGAAGEDVASALRENGVGILVGKHTAGRFAGGQFNQLQDGSNLTLAFQACRSGQGQEIEGVGLEPDLTVELDPAALAEGRDSQLQAALDYLKAKLGG